MNNVKNDLSSLDEVFAKYEPKENNLITILQKAQDIYGYLPKDVMYYIAEKVGVSPAKVVGVATFYTQFRLEPIGKYFIQLCQGTACHVNGSERLEKIIGQHLGIKNGETTKDGLFTLKTVACLGCCSLSPVMMINGETYSALDEKKVIKVLDELKANA